jgi:hypothetical protein
MPRSRRAEPLAQPAQVIDSTPAACEPTLDSGSSFQQSSDVARLTSPRDGMTGFRSGVILVATLGAWASDAAGADEPGRAGASAEPAAPAEPSVTDTTPRSPIPATPAPPRAPAPLVAQPASAAPPDPVSFPPRAADPDASTVAPRDPRFGDAGQWTLNGALSAGFGHLGYDASSGSSTSIGVEPAFDHFVSSNFSVGTNAFFRYATSVSASGVDGRSTTVGLTGRTGHNFWLADRVSFWPKLAVGVWRNWLNYSAPSPGFTVTIDGVVIPIGQSTDLKEDAVFIEIQAPVLLHVTQHFFVGFGPNVYVDVLHSVESTSNRRRFVGASSTVGGWF